MTSDNSRDTHRTILLRLQVGDTPVAVASIFSPRRGSNSPHLHRAKLDPHLLKLAKLSFAQSFIQKRYRINQYIRTSPVRVIDENGKNLGVMETTEALRLAGERGLDLIEIAPTVTPPVCRIMEFGKFKYEREKGEREHSKKRGSEVKGIRIGFATGKHDLALRAEQARKFLEKGNKVRIEMRLRGREKAHPDFALKRFHEFLDSLPMEFEIESPPQRFPRGFAAVIVKK